MGYVSRLDQMVLAHFLFEGHFARHIRRMRALYAERQHDLITAVRTLLSGVLDVRPEPAGIHLVGWLADGVGDRTVARESQRRNVVAPPISRFQIDRSTASPGLLLGYAAVDGIAIRAGVERLAAAIDAAHSSHPRQ